MPRRPQIPRRAKIVCTLGPSSNFYEKIKAIAKAGMDVARLNFSHGTHDDHRKVIMDCMDDINDKMGSHKLTYASAGTKKPWQMKREQLTPSYTTSWKHIPVVKAI